MSYKGTILSEKSKRKISNAHKGTKKPWAGKYKHELFSEEHKKNIGKALKGHTVSIETRNKIKNSLIGRLFSEGRKKRISIGRKGKLTGAEHPNWQGGKSFEPYTIDWTETLKRSIRERDRYTCQICGELQRNITFSVHHINYDKKNCNPQNLITLCNKCHMKTNFNRKYWKEYFDSWLIERFTPVKGWTEEDLTKIKQ